jgi:hypothetical protein
MRRAWIPVALIAITVASAGRLEAQDDVIDRVLAVVGDRIISLSDVRGASEFGLVETGPGPDPVAAVLDKLIDRELELEEVRRYEPPEPQTAAIDARIAVIRGRFPTPAAFEAALLRSGLDEQRLRELIKDELRIAAYLDERFIGPAQPTDDEVEAHVREHGQELLGDGRSLEAARDLARQRLTAERRQALVADWLAGLRRRAVITELYLPAS